MDESLLKDLDNYAEELERSRTYLIEKAVTSYFDTLDEMLSDNRIDNLKNGSSEIVSMKDVFNKAGISV